MRAGRTAGAAHQRYLFARPDAFADGNQQLAVVAVARHQAVTVVNLDQIAESSITPGKNHHAVGNGSHRVADMATEIQAAMKLAATGDRIGADTAMRAHVPDADRHTGRGRADRKRVV